MSIIVFYIVCKHRYPSTKKGFAPMCETSFCFYGELFTFTAAFIAAEALGFSICYEDGIAAVAHTQRGLILSHHEAEHHLQANQQRMEVPNDGGFVQQRNSASRCNTAKGCNALCHKFLFIRIKGIAMLIKILAGDKRKGHIFQRSTRILSSSTEMAEPSTRDR